MKRLITAITIFSIIIFTVAVSGTAHAKNRIKVMHYKVTITNITRGQILSPPVVISHNSNFQLFNLGEPATMELAYLAEDANTEPLTDFLKTQSSVFNFTVGEGVILPGDSATVEIKTKSGFRLVSAAAMLVTTNDAFMSVRGVYARSGETTVVNATAYDAGSEDNSEDCAYIPGPPCGNGGVRDTDGAEGYVYIHSGIHGIGGLDPAEFDWLNPVATIKIERVK